MCVVPEGANELRSFFALVMPHQREKPRGVIKLPHSLAGTFLRHFRGHFASGAQVTFPSYPMHLLRLSAFVLLAAFSSVVHAATRSAEPVTPGAMPETRALLQLLYDVSGQHMLTGQHNYPAIRDRNTQFAADYTGHMPAVFSTDFGHAKEGDSDSYLARPEIVQECFRQHQLGALVTICWHAVPPTADEPVTFRQLPDSDPKALKSVQGKLLDEQFRDVLTPGTALHTKWMQQVDAIAVFLKQLQDARVPVLWRPYHEMNGDWFWWGGRTGEYSTERLYRQIFDRLVNHHQLKNLVWVWSMDRVSRPGMEHEKYFPGIEYVDVLGLDVYGNDFAQSYYESLEKLSQGKPLALAEVGNPPALEILDRQPKWTFYVTWAGMVRNVTRSTYAQLMADPRLVNLDDPRYAEITADYRRSLQLPPVKFIRPAADFSGVWILNEDLSEFGRNGPGSSPARFDVDHQGDRLAVKSTRILEFADDRVSEETYTLDGTETRSEVMNMPRVTKAQRSDENQKIVFDSVVDFIWGPPGSKMNIHETWELLSAGRQLRVTTKAETPRGTQETSVIYDRR